jgi:uncharacterized membrane protein (UPF0127 family)
MARYLISIASLALLAASCAGGDADNAATAAPVVTTPVTTSPVELPPVTVGPVETSPVVTGPVATSEVISVPVVLSEYRVTTILIDGMELLVAVADNDGLRVQGLMEVTDLGSLDGMLFVWDEDVTETFWMKNTPMALDIAWFDGQGSFVSSLTMQPCPPDETCSTYAADGPYVYAVEMRAGTMPDFAAGSVLEFTDD